jgi:hypothetical protein
MGPSKSIKIFRHYCSHRTACYHKYQHKEEVKNDVNNMYFVTLWKSPLESGDTKWLKHDMAPADSPMIVTLFLSPPNAEM